MFKFFNKNNNVIFIKEFKYKGGKIIKEVLKNILILGLVFILLEVSYSKFIKKEKPVTLLGFSFLIVTTGSMEPEIDAGELIIIKISEKYKEKDIVTFLDQDDFLVTHRIVELKENSIITKGDNNDLVDEPVVYSSVKGKVIFHSKLLGFFVLYLLKPLTFIYIIFVLIINILKIFFTKEREESENENKQIKKQNCIDSNN